MPDPTTLYRIVRASGGGRRSAQRALTPLIGRDEEIAMLLKRWEHARQGEGQFVLIVGEPGLGKSRLIEEFRTRLRETPHTWVEWSSSQLLQNTPLHPIADWGRQRFGDATSPTRCSTRSPASRNPSCNPRSNASPRRIFSSTRVRNGAHVRRCNRGGFGKLGNHCGLLRTWMVELRGFELRTRL